MPGDEWQDDPDDDVERTADRRAARDGRDDDLDQRPGSGAGPDLDGLLDGGPARQVSWTTRAILAVVVPASAVAAWFLATAFLPRWWAQRVADVVDRSFTAGLFAGLTCGVVFTAAPLLLLRPALRRQVGAGTRLAWAAVAAVSAVPNVITLGIVLGGNAAARAGLRTMDAGAPGFRGASLAGALLGTVAVVTLWAALRAHHRRSRELARVRDELARARAELRRRDEEADAEGDVDGR